MKIIKTLILLITIGTSFISCKKDVEGCMDPKSCSYNADATIDDGSCVAYCSTPSTYSFTNSDGESTVSFSGQQQRLDMLSEIVTYLKTANTKGVELDSAVLSNMYANASYTWDDANSLGMTGSSKQLKSKTAEGDAGIQALFEEYFGMVAKVSKSSVDGEKGVDGVWPAGTKGPYLQSGKGIEYAQLIEKGLMGAVFYSQMTTNYLAGINNDDNSSKVDGKEYTEMEHHWDEAYGYFTSEIDFPTNGTNRFWGKYANSREDVLGSKTKIAEAFRKGRAAIANKDYTERDAQKIIILDEMEKLCGGTAIHYLNTARTQVGDQVAVNHSLSEARAFIFSLQFGQNSKDGKNITKANVDAILLGLGDDNTEVTNSQLNKAIDDLALYLDLTPIKVIL